MAFRTRKEAQAMREAALASAEPYVITNAEEAANLFDRIRFKKEHAKDDRWEKTLTHLRTKPNDKSALAALSIVKDCDPVNWHHPEVRERAILKALAVLNGEEIPSIASL